MTTPKVEVTSADIARIAGVGPNAVSNWRKRHDDFPKPVGGTDRSPRFALSEIQRWLASQGKSADISADQKLWQAFESARTAVHPVDALGMVGILLWYLHNEPEVDIPSNSNDLARLMERAEHYCLTTMKAVPGLLDVMITTEYGARHSSLLHAAAEAAAANGAHETFASLCDRVLGSGSRAGLAPTSPELAELMLELAGPARGVVLDPACGTGSILLAAADQGYTRLLGQELNPSIARVALLRLAFHGDTGKADGYDIQVGDSFLDDRYRGRAATAVVSSPPFADRTWWHDQLAHDSRWIYGTPARLDSELAWVQHALSHVAPGGSVVMLMPPAAAQRASGRRIRTGLLQRGAVRAVISLPPRLATGYSLPLQLWVLTRPPADAPPPPPVLMLDTTGQLPHATGEEISWEQVRHLIATNWLAFSADPAGFHGRAGVARAVPTTDILDEEVDLTPRRHLPPPTEPWIATDALETTRMALAEQLADLTALLPDVPDTRALDLAPTRTATVDELVKAGLMFLRRPGTVPETVGTEPSETINVQILDARDLVLGLEPTKIGAVAADEVGNPPIRSGDVLIPAVGRRLTARAATSADLGAYPANTVIVLRPDPEVLDPWFLAGFLSSSDGNRQAARLSSAIGPNLRFDPRKVRVPLLPLDTQRAYGTAFERLSRFNLALRAAHNLGQELVGYTTDALTVPLASFTPS